MPKNFCELDKRESCTEGKCIRYDPLKFKSSPSIMTYFPGGRLGNMLSAYLNSYWMKRDFGYDVYFPKKDYEVRHFFPSEIAIADHEMHLFRVY